MKIEIQLSVSSENENGIWNSVFQSCRKMKNKNRSLNFVFGNRRKTENANGISNFVFKCRRRTVGTRVHAFFFLKASMISSHRYENVTDIILDFLQNRVFCLPQTRTNYGIFNIRFAGPKLWNSVKESIKSLSIFSFKKKYKQLHILAY